jgi:hypothetical protein
VPVESEAQFKAMEAAKHGHSTLGIPAAVGREFVPPGSHKPAGLPERKSPLARAKDHLRRSVQ